MMPATMHLRRSISSGCRSLALALLGTLAVHGTAAPLPEPLALGSAMPDFMLPGIDGRTYTPADFSTARVLAVVFTSNHCPTAQAYEKRFRDLVTEFGGRGLALVAINPNHAPAVRPDELAYSDLGDTLAEMQERARDRQFNFPYLDDGPGQEVVARFGARATPHVFLFDAQRRLRYQGRVDDSEREESVTHHDTRAAIEALLAGREPPTPATRVFGCSVKWRDKLPDVARFREKVAREPVRLEPAGIEELRRLRENNDSGKVRMIHVWATWCGPCVTEFPELVDHHLRFRRRPFELVTVAAQEPEAAPRVRKFLEDHHASMRNHLFATSDKYAHIEALDSAWNGELPYTLLVGPDGTILLRQSGPIDFLALRRELLTVLDRLDPWSIRVKPAGR